jgi:glycosyltransferase involved in cell wall biosynthesis
MKIAVIVPSLRDLAPVQVAVSIAVQLRRLGHEVTVYHLSSRKELPEPHGIRFEKISFWGSMEWRKYEVIHSHGFMPDAFVSFRKPFRCKAKTVSTIHNYVFEELTMLYNRFVSWSVGAAWWMAWTGMDHLVVLTDDALEYYRSISRKKLSRIYNGKNIIPDPSMIMPEHKLLIEEMRNRFKYVIGTYSALISRKRIDILIRHLIRVETGCLIILGEGPERKNLESLVIKYNLQDRVKFLGHIPQAHKYNYEFDISAHPSSSEGFSLSLIEAALHKKKIVCSNIPSFKEAFNNTEVTFFESDNEMTIDQAIQDALLDDYKANNAFLKANTYYTEERMGKEYADLFIRLSTDIS